MKVLHYTVVASLHLIYVIYVYVAPRFKFWDHWGVRFRNSVTVPLFLGSAGLRGPRS